MEYIGEMNNILPTDDELVRREDVFLGLFGKYSIDEGSDPELIEDVDTVSSYVSDDDHSSDSSFEEMSTDEVCDDFDTEKLGEQLQSVISDRVNAWTEKGINFQLKTVHPSVTVEEWLMANMDESTTTTEKIKKTVINEDNKMTIITEETKTTKSRKSYSGYIRSKCSSNENRMEIVTNEQDVQKHQDNQEPFSYVDLNNSKKFDLPSGPRNEKFNRNFGQRKSAPSRKVKNLSKFSPKKGKKQNLKQAKPTNSSSKRTASKSGKEVLHSEGIVRDLDQDETTDTISIVPKKSEKPRNESNHSKVQSTSVYKPPPKVVIYAPGERFGTETNDEYVSVTKADFEKRIDRKHHQDLSLIKDMIVPVHQTVVYQPPSDTTWISADDDSEADDVLLTNFTRTGRIVLLNSK